MKQKFIFWNKNKFYDKWDNELRQILGGQAVKTFKTNKIILTTNQEAHWQNWGDVLVFLLFCLFCFAF